MTIEEHTVRSKPRFFGVTDDDPFGVDTWSGSSRYLFGELERNGCLADATGTQPTGPAALIRKLLNFQVGLDRWRFNYHLDPAIFIERTAIARRAIARCTSNPNCVLQVGAWYDLSGREIPTVSYHDGNLARRLNNPFGFPNIGSGRIQRALEYEKQLYQRLDIIFPMSQWLADSFVKDFGVMDDKLFPVYAGINLPDKLHYAAAAYDSKHIIFVGKDFERKGGPTLLSAFSLLRRQIPDATLTIVGPTLNIDLPGVRCVGAISKATSGGIQRLELLYKSASLFVMPTLYEPFGIAFAEAMSFGLPCVGTNICAIPEIIRHGETGLMVEPGDAEALAMAMFNVMSDPAGGKAMGEAGFHVYRAQFRWECVVQRICSHVSSRLLS